MIYFVQSGKRGLIKIGKSNNPQKRISSLQGASAKNLIVLGVMPGDIEEEKNIHNKFSNQRIRGEWFSTSRDLIKFIKKNAQKPHWISETLRVDEFKNYHQPGMPIKQKDKEWFLSQGCDMEDIADLIKMEWDSREEALLDHYINIGYGELLYALQESLKNVNDSSFLKALKIEFQNVIGQREEEITLKEVRA